MIIFSLYEILAIAGLIFTLGIVVGLIIATRGD